MLALEIHAMSTFLRRTALLFLGMLWCLLGQTDAIKFELEASRNPTPSRSLPNFAILLPRLLTSRSVQNGKCVVFTCRSPCSYRRLSSCSIWNFANAHTLVIVTTNVSPGTSSDTSGGSDQTVDLEIIDGSHAGSKYLTKKVRASFSHALALTVQI